VSKAAERQLLAAPPAAAFPAGGFARLEDARAFLAAAEQTVARLPAEQLPEFFPLLASVYDEFPELEAETPPRALAERLRTLADGLAETTALPLLLLCAAWDPAACATPLLAKAAAHGLETLLPVLRLLRDHREFDWDEVLPTIDALRRRFSWADAAAAVAAVLDRLTPGGEPDKIDAAMRSLISTNATTGAGGLAAVVAAARRRLVKAPPATVAQERRLALLAMAERLSPLVTATPAGHPPLEVGWPDGRFAFVEFLAQWPGFETVVPAAALQTAYATPTAEGGLRADRHEGAPFCRGPHLRLPAGRYTIRLSGGTGPEVAFTVSAARYFGARRIVVCERLWESKTPLSGVIAELAFDSDTAMRDFEIAVQVDRPQVHFELADIGIAMRQPRQDAAP
jgi:hypothetical protein